MLHTNKPSAAVRNSLSAYLSSKVSKVSKIDMHWQKCQEASSKQSQVSALYTWLWPAETARREELQSPVCQVSRQADLAACLISFCNTVNYVGSAYAVLGLWGHLRRIAVQQIAAANLTDRLAGYNHLSSS